MEHGGPPDLLANPKGHLATAPVTLAVHPDKPGRIAAMNAREYGLVILELGGGRRAATDKIDPAVGLSKCAGIGERVDRERPIAIIHACAGTKSPRPRPPPLSKKAVTLTDASEAPPILVDRITAEAAA